MGIYDIYCFLCGLPCHSCELNREIIDDDINYYKKNENKKYKKNNIYNYYKYCERNKIDIYKEINKIKILTQWVNKCTFLTITNEIIHKCIETNGNINFINKITKKEYLHMSYEQAVFEKETQNRGVFVHTACWQYIKNKYNIELKYSDLTHPFINYYKVFNFNYGECEKYYEQIFDYIGVLYDKNEKILINPLDAKHPVIDKIFKLLQIKKNRSGPSVSATLYKEGIYKIGENKLLWVKNNNKWVKYNDKDGKLEIYDIQMSNFNKNKLIKIPFIAEENTKPLFILSNNNNKYKILATSKTIKNILC
jgi:hypothetical protein